MVSYHPSGDIYWSMTCEVPKGTFSHIAGDNTKLKEEVVKRTNKMIPFFREIVAKGELSHHLEFHDRDPTVITPAGRLTNRQNSRITLIGDAAHLMVPYRAQGGNNALLDSRDLVKRLSGLLEHNKTHSIREEDLIEALYVLEIVVGRVLWH